MPNYDVTVCVKFFKNHVSSYFDAKYLLLLPVNYYKKLIWDVSRQSLIGTEVPSSYLIDNIINYSWNVEKSCFSVVFLPRVIRFQRQDAVVGDSVGRSCNMGTYNVVYYDADQVKSRLLLALNHTLRSSSSAWQILVLTLQVLLRYPYNYTFLKIYTSWEFNSIGIFLKFSPLWRHVVDKRGWVKNT